MYLPSILNTTIILANLRREFVDNSLDAYIIPYGGEHYDERVADCDARIQFVCGFGGSAGSVIIPTNSSVKAMLWTDGRYFNEAELTLDRAYWQLMKDGQAGVPTQAQWLIENILPGRRVGVAATTYPKSTFDTMKQALLSASNIELVDTEDLVVKVWETCVEPDCPLRPSCPMEPVHDLPYNFSGKNVLDKLVDVRALMQNEGADYALVSELEEVAWLLNLRGEDLPDASVFFGFVILGSDTLDVFIDTIKINGTNNETNRTVEDILVGYGANLHSYSELASYLNETALAPTTNKIWLSKYVNARLANSVPVEKQLIKLSPVILMKSKKNIIEVQGMRNAHLRDSAAIVAFQYWLKEQLDAGVTNITEYSASETLKDIRTRREYYKGQSFNTIAGFGSNGAIIHYRPPVEGSAHINKSEMFLLDSGGLYLDGTCDITRTMHFGTPSEENKNMYTRVLKGHIALAMAIFPDKTVGSRLDSFARKALWDVGLNYNHGTGHGIGHYLNVHEGPQRIAGVYSPDDSGLEENMFVSNEPGYYKDGAYGIRIENIVRIARAQNYSGFLSIETVSFVPLSRNLINVDMLTEQEIQWVDNYHAECLEKVGEYIDQHDDLLPAVRTYLAQETAPLRAEVTGGSMQISAISSLFLFAIAFFVVY